MMREYRSKEIYGDFYENGQKPLAVVLAGSKAGIPTVGETLLDYLRINYNVMLLAYFGVGELPETLERVPVEYFVNVISLIREKLKLDYDQVILIGNSKGAEIALLLANYLDSAMTIACVPGCYVFQGLPMVQGKTFDTIVPKSSWSFHNTDVPYIRFSYNEKIIRDIKNGIYCTCYEESIQNNFNQDALINVGNYQGKVLLLSAANDRYWPSKKMSKILVANSQNKNKITHQVLDLEGHYFLQYEESMRIIITFLENNIKGK